MGNMNLTLCQKRTLKVVFFKPDSLNVDSFLDGDKFIVHGHRGTGKTTILRWISIASTKRDIIPLFLLFKSEISEEAKQKYSITAGIKEISTKLDGYSIFQDFKDVWRIVLIARLCEHVIHIKECSETIAPARTILNLLGYGGTKSGVLGYLPSILKSLKIKIRDPSSGLEYEGGIAPEKQGKLEYSPNELAVQIKSIFKQLKFRSRIIFLIDEIEIFNKSDDQYNRDRSLVRDIVMVADELNREFRNQGVPIKVICALRTEIINTIGASGEEISKIMMDFGSEVSWHSEATSSSHPLIRLLFRKLRVRYKARGITIDPRRLIPASIMDQEWYSYLLDNTLCRPRNIINRLRLIQEDRPADYTFSKEAFVSTEGRYSQSVLNELEYSLGAIYDRYTVEGVKLALHSRSASFDVREFKERVAQVKKYHQKAGKAVEESGVERVLISLFEFGAIGNSFYDKAANKQIHLWSFRGELYPRLDQKFFVQRSLRKALSIM